MGRMTNVRRIAIDFARRRFPDAGDFFDAKKVRMRIAIATEFAVAWSPMMPPIAFVALVYVAVEKGCANVARHYLGIGSEDETSYVSRLQILIGFLLSACLFSLHIAA